MRIGINTFFLQRPNTGSGQYCARLIEALAEIDPENEYHLIAPNPSALPGRAAPGAHVAQSAPLPLTRQLAKVWFEQVGVPRVCKQQKLDLVHYPYFAAPLACPSPVVLTLHDLIPLLLDEYKGPLPVRAYSRLVAAGARRARGIIADSECTRRDIVRALGIPEERIRVVHLAPSARYRRIADIDAARAIRRKYSLSSDFVFYLGGVDARKNVVRLIQAFARIRTESGRKWRLAIAGEAASESPLFPNLREVAQKEQVADGVVFLGKVPEEDCLALYNATSLFVYPSLYEGFGLPPIEAMACGAPVICSNTSSLPEVVGDAAIVVDPTKVGDLALAMQRVLESPELQEQLRQKGMARAKMFTWRKTAEGTLAAFREFASCAY